MTYVLSLTTIFRSKGSKGGSVAQRSTRSGIKSKLRNEETDEDDLSVIDSAEMDSEGGSVIILCLSCELCVLYDRLISSHTAYFWNDFIRMMKFRWLEAMNCTNELRAWKKGENVIASMAFFMLQLGGICQNWKKDSRCMHSQEEFWCFLPIEYGFFLAVTERQREPVWCTKAYTTPRCSVRGSGSNSI